LKRALKILLALTLLAALYAHADWHSVGRCIAELDAAWLAAALLLFVPQTLLSAVRWRALVAPLSTIGIGEGIRQTLAASAWNLIAPSKLGEFSKAAMLPLAGRKRVEAAGLVAIEKSADVAALLALWGLGSLNGWITLAGGCLLGLLLTIAGRRWLSLAAASSLLWVLHLAQIDLFLKAAGVFCPWHATLARVPAALFAGLLPVSFCGVGARDTALVWLFADLASPATMAAVGLLTASRYLIPGLVGIPLASGYRSGYRAATCSLTG
jgi:hypothetical protein